MENLLNFVKEKSYYLLGGTVLIIILLIAISACSNGASSYEKIESNMVDAARAYFEENKSKLPKNDGDIVKVTNSTLIESEYLSDFMDPEDESNSCSGYVEVMKEKKEYFYIPFLTCPGNYESKYLIDEIKNVGIDELGNGIYNIGDEYIYRGSDVNNYISFANKTWRILKVDASGDIKLLSNEAYNDEMYAWDTKYNSDFDDYVGNNSNYLLSDMRKTLQEYYETSFSAEEKAKIVYKNICTGAVNLEDSFNIEKECSKIQEKEKVSLMNVSDFKNATLDNSCIKVSDKTCTNRNYLANYELSTWLLNPSEDNSYTQMYLYISLDAKMTNLENMVFPVIYLNSKSVLKSGDGTLENPYIIK